MPPSWWASGSRDAPRRSTSSSSPWKYWKADEGGWVNSCSSATDPPSEDDEVFTPEPKQQRNSEAGGATRTAVIVTWNCNYAAPDTDNRDKLVKTLARLRAKPDALALQETLFKDEDRLQYAMRATPEYVWHCPPGKRRPCCETNEQVDLMSYRGRGSWLLIRKGGPLDGGEVLDLDWDYQHRIVALRTAHGLVVGAYLPAGTNLNAQEDDDCAQYYLHFCAFLEAHKDDLLAVVGDLQMGFCVYDVITKAGSHPDPRRCNFSLQLDFLRRAGLKDAWRATNPEPKAEFTRRTTSRLGGGWHRVDHVLVPKDRSATAKICSELKPLEDGRSSDHIPVLLAVSLDAKAEPDDDEVEFSHVRTADERNAEGFANAEFVG
jgi:exonuclease III